MSRSTSPFDSTIKEETMDALLDAIDESMDTEVQVPQIPLLDVKMELDSEIKKEQNSITSLIMNDTELKSPEFENETNIEDPVIATTSTNRVSESNKRANNEYWNCCVYGCPNDINNSPSLPFFVVPTPQVGREQWLKLINRLDLRMQSTQCFVCALHFNEKDIEHLISGPILKEDAVPALNLPAAPEKDQIIQTAQNAIQMHTFPTSPLSPPALAPIAPIATNPVLILPSASESIIMNNNEAMQTSPNIIIINNDQAIPNAPNIIIVNTQTENAGADSIPTAFPALNLPPASEKDHAIQTKPTLKRIAPGDQSFLPVLKRARVPKLKLAPVPKTDQASQTPQNMFDICTQTLKWTSDSKDTQTSNGDEDLVSQIAALKNQISDCKKKVKDQNSAAGCRAIFGKLCDNFLSDQLADLVKTQTYLKEHHSGNRYSRYIKNVCLNLYQVSPQAYHLIEKAFYLPSRSTLEKAFVPVTSMVNDDLIEKFKVKVDSMTELERNCTIVVDSMLIRHALFYHIGQDKIIGLHEVDGRQSPFLARMAMVVIVQGLFVRWVQPIGYALMSRSKGYDDDTSRWLHKILDKLIMTGLKIRTLISNEKSVFNDMVNQHDISMDKTYFIVNQTKIYYVFDSSPLIIELRDSFTKNDFCYFDDNTAKHDHVRQFQAEDNKRSTKFAENLEIDTVHPRQQQKIATTELFSKQVAAAISTYIDLNVIDASAAKTVDFLLLIEELHDTLNSRISLGNGQKLHFLRKMSRLFKTMKLINPSNGKEVPAKVQFIRGFYVTIVSLLSLIEDLKLEKHKLLPANSLNLDQIKMFYDKLRDRHNYGPQPTSRQFVLSFRVMFFTYLRKRNKIGRTVDLSKFISQLNELSKLKADISNPSTSTHKDICLLVDDNDKPPNEFEEISLSHYTHFKMPPNIEDELYHLTDFLFKQTLTQHEKCAVLQPKLDASTSLSDFPVVIKYVKKMENTFHEAFKKFCLNSNIAKTIYEQITSIPFEPPCPCFPVTYLMKLFVRTRIFLAVHYNNKIVRRTCNNDDFKLILRKLEHKKPIRLDTNPYYSK